MVLITTNYHIHSLKTNYQFVCSSNIRVFSLNFFQVKPWCVSLHFRTHFIQCFFLPHLTYKEENFRSEVTTDIHFIFRHYLFLWISIAKELKSKYIQIYNKKEHQQTNFITLYKTCYIFSQSTAEHTKD